MCNEFLSILGVMLLIGASFWTIFMIAGVGCKKCQLLV